MCVYCWGWVGYGTGKDGVAEGVWGEGWGEGVKGLDGMRPLEFGEYRPTVTSRNTSLNRQGSGLSIPQGKYKSYPRYSP